MPIEWDEDRPKAPRAPAGHIAWDDEQPDSGGFLQQGVYGINRGLARIIPYQLLPEGAEQFVRNRLLGENRPPQGAVERIAGRTGEEIGATVPLAAATMGLSGAVQPLAQGVGNMAQRGLGHLAQSINSTPARAAIGEAVAATGAGAGAGAAQEVAPGNPYAEMAGQLAGGLAPGALAYAPASLAMKLGRRALSRISPNATRAAATDAVSQTIGGELTPQALANLREAEKVAGGIEGFRPSLAEASGSPSLIATQRGIERGLSGKALEQAAMRREGNQAALGRFATEKAPPGRGFDFVIDAATKAVNDIRTGIATRQGETAALRGAVADRLPTADRFKAGGDLRGTLVKAERHAAAEMGRLRQQLGLNDADVTVPFREFAETIAAAGPDSVFRDLRRYPEIMGIIRRAGAGEVETGAPKTYADGPDEMPIGGLESGFIDSTAPFPEPTQVNVSFRDLMALREEIGFQYRNARGAANPDARKVRLLGMLREEVDNLLDGLDFPDPQLAANYKQFRQAYFQDYVERFKKGVAYRVRAKDGRGFYRTDDEDVASAFFKPGDVSAAKQFKAVYGSDPDAHAALEAVALDSLRRAAVRDGKVDPQAYETWLRNHQSVLAEFPEIAAKVRNVGSTNRALMAREAELTQRARDIEDQVLVKALGRVASGEKTPDQLLAEAMTSPQKMGQLKALIRGNELAEKALARAMWGRAVGERDLATFLRQNEAVLKMGLSPEHIRNLETLASAREMTARVPEPTGAAVEPRPFQGIEDATRMGVPQIASRIFAVQSGRTSWRFVLSEAGSRALRGYTQEQMEALLREALYDPQVAKDLASAARMKSMPPAIANRLNVRLFNLGMETRDAKREDRPEPSIIPRGIGRQPMLNFRP